VSRTTYRFNKDERDFSDFNYAYSPHAEGRNKFFLYDNCIANFEPERREEFNYVSLITKKKYGIGTRVSTKCVFKKFGAPLIVFTDDMTDEVGGTKLYGLHFEVVAYEGGCNVWHIVPDPENVKRPIKSTKIGNMAFSIEPDEVIDISVGFKSKKISICVNGNSSDVENEDFPENFCVGITACEGANKFYEFEIEE